MDQIENIEPEDVEGVMEEINMVKDWMAEKVAQIESRMQRMEEKAAAASAPQLTAAPEPAVDLEIEEETQLLPGLVADLPGEWRTNLQHYVLKPANPKELLSESQLAFFLWFRANNEELGKTSWRMAECIKDRGVREGFWSKDWTPSESVKFSPYLFEKLKTISKNEKKKRMSAEMEARVATTNETVELTRKERNLAQKKLLEEEFEKSKLGEKRKE